MNCTDTLIALLKKYSKVDFDCEKWNNEIILERDLGIDSIMLLELVVDIEDEFDISIADDELDADIIGTYGGLLALIETKMAGKN